MGIRRQDNRQRGALNNVLWFGGSLALAFLVWLVAVVQSDPVAQRTLNERVPIRLTPNPSLIITNQDTLAVNSRITVRGPGSVVAVMSPDDILLSVDLTNYSPGDYIVPIQSLIPPEKRASVVSMTPATLNVRLETRLTELKPVRVEITDAPAVIFAVGEPESEIRQVEVTGPESRVTQVSEVVARVSLSGQRSSFDNDVTLIALDEDGENVSGVTIADPTTRVVIDIRQRTDVAEVRVQPNIIGELPEGYVLTPDFDYSPQVVVVRGTETALANLPGTFFTDPIDLSDRTASFEATVPVLLPDSRLLVVTGGSITVHIGIAAQQVTRQFDHVPLTLIGAAEDLTYQLSTQEVTVFVTGPQPLLDRMDSEELGALVDVTGLRAGDTAQIVPVPSIGQDNDDVTASVLPAEIDVTVRAGSTPTPNAP